LTPILDSRNQGEWNILVELAPLPNQTLGPTYNTLLTPLLSLFSNTPSSLISLIKRSLHKYTFLALSSFESLSSLQRRWDELLQRRGTDARRETNELKDGLLALRGVRLRSFPEFLADIKLAAVSKGGDSSTGLADFTLMVGFVCSLPSPASKPNEFSY
jgi:exocyst complex protein 7